MSFWKLDLLYLFAGAIVGFLLRYKIANNEIYFNGIPVSILIVNVLGSFILGLTMSTVSKFRLSENYVLLVAVGFCGSLTTMSSFAYETVGLISAGRIFMGFLEIVLNAGLSILAVVAGSALISIISALV